MSPNLSKAGSKRPRILCAIALGVLLAVVWGCASHFQAAPVAPAQKIVFLGDSITKAGAKPFGFLTLASEVLDKAYPDMGLQVVGAGVSGNKVTDCQRRLERDVLRKDPVAVVVYIGINDVLRWEENQGTTIENFEAGLRDIVTRSQARGAGVILCTPTVLGEKIDGTNRFDRMLDDYAEVGRRVARETGAQLLDLRKAFMDFLKAHNQKNAERGVLTRDGIHLNQAGDVFLAGLVLDALNVPDGLHDLDECLP
jgi:lysophospholipase L1-like esterase